MNKGFLKLTATGAAALLISGAGQGLSAPNPPASIPIRTVTMNNHPVRVQIGLAPDAAGQRVVDAFVQALTRRMSGDTAPLLLRVIPGTRASQGYFEEVLIQGRAINIRRMRISELNLHARNIHIDVPHLFAERKVQTVSSQTTLRAVVTQEDLTAMLARGRHTSDMQLTVTYLTGNRFRITGNWNWTWFSGPIIGVGQLSTGTGNTVNVSVLSLKLNGSEVPDFVKTKFEERLNPLIDYDDVPFSPRFRALRMVGTRAYITA